MKISDFIAGNLQSLQNHYDKEEARTILETLVCDTLELKFRLSEADKGKQLLPTEVELLNKGVLSLSMGIPVQYVTGVAYFMDVVLKVDQYVLIPRPETEELVELIIKRYHSKRNLTVLDVGCGSGCIGIQLAHSLPGSQVTAVDTSEGAVKITEQNARMNGVEVVTTLADVLTDPEKLKGEYDIIVSNPPYIHPSESDQVDDLVLKFEPHLALFTPTEDALIFYRKILSLAKQYLKQEGSIFFEVNPEHNDELAHLVESHGWTFKIHVDISGKSRMFEIGKKS